MRIKVLLSVLLVGMSFLTKANSRIDSLRAVVENSDQDSVKAVTYNRLFNVLIYEDREEAHLVAKAALKLAIKNDLYGIMAVASGNLGIWHHMRGEFADAIGYYVQSNDYSMMCFDKEGEVAKNFTNMGIIYTSLGNYEKALETLLNALDEYSMTDMAKYRQDVASVHNALGRLYREMKRFDKAESSYYEAFVINKDLGNELGIAKSYNNLGNVYNELDSLDMALQYYHDALEIKERIKAIRHIPSTLSNIGGILQKQHKYEEAITKYKQALIYYEDLNNTRVVPGVYANLADLYFEKDDKKKALKYFKRAEELAGATGNKEQLNKIYEGLAKVYDESGDFKTAYKYFKKHVEIQQEFFKDNNAVQMAQMHTAFESDKKERQISDLRKDRSISELEIKQHKAEIDKQEVVLYSAAGGIALLVVLAIVMLRSIQHRKKANRLLSKQHEEIQVQKKKIEQILLNILPEDTLNELKNKGKYTAKNVDGTSVLFTDFKGFTMISERMTPQELVDELDTYFMRFDEIMTKYRIEKIKTIGDAYMAAAGVPHKTPNNPVAITLAAMEIKEVVDELKREREARGDEFFRIRIGVHTGAVTAGVVGKTKWTYDIWGDTVNTAARMESSGEPGHVNVSNNTYQEISAYFECSHRGQIAAKNKGNLDMYFVDRIKPEYAADEAGRVPNDKLLNLIGKGLLESGDSN